MHPFLNILLLSLLQACWGGADPAALQTGIEAAMGAKDYPGAVAQADQALKQAEISKDPAKAWRFESLRLNALASGGKGKEVLDSLNRLASTYPKQLTAALYHALADKVRAAGDGSGYADLLDAGKRRFPEDPSFQAAIDDMKNSADPEEIERLKALGYL